MTDALDESTSAWALAIIRFEVTWSGAVLVFEDVAGLETGASTLRAEGSSGVDAMPASGKQGKVTLRKGLFHGTGSFRDWYDPVKMSTVARKPMTIRLLDEGGQAVVTWTLARAWPAQITGSGLDGAHEEPVVDSLVVAHEGVTFAAA